MRIESKYNIPIDKKQFIINDLYTLGFTKDSFCNDGTYKVNSIYFDDLNFSDYFDKLNGIYKRKKIRFRFYGYNFSTLNLEVKHKLGIFSWKKIKVFTSDDYEDYIKNRSGKINDYFASHFNEYLEPKIFISYNRYALANNFLNQRVTFDADLSWHANLKCADLNKIIKYPFSYNYPQMNILELKLNNLYSDSLSSLIKKYNLKWIENSKYEIALSNFMNILL